MATSGTTAFDLDIDEIIQEAYERCGVTARTGYGIKSARRSLNILFSEWGNRGVHLWKVSLNEVALTAGTAQYAVNSSVNDVLEAYISTTAAAWGADYEPHEAWTPVVPWNSRAPSPLSHPWKLQLRPFEGSLWGFHRTN